MHRNSHHQPSSSTASQISTSSKFSLGLYATKCGAVSRDSVQVNTLDPPMRTQTPRNNDIYTLNDATVSRNVKGTQPRPETTIISLCNR